MPQITKEKDLMTSNIQQSTFVDDEIDLKELILVLWNRKLLIILSILVAIIASSIYVNMKPNIYEAKAVFTVNSDPYGNVESQGLSGSVDNMKTKAFEYLSSRAIQEKIVTLSGSLSLNLNISIDAKAGEIIATKQGENAQDIFNEVFIFTKYANQVYIQNELDKVKGKLVPVKKLLEKQKVPEVKKLIAENYSYLIYKEALLESGSIELVKVTTAALKPVNYIKPKRLFIVLLATLFTGFVSAFFTLCYDFLMRKSN